MGKETWHFPVMFSYGAGDVDVLELLGPNGMAEQVDHGQIDSAFTVYKNYIEMNF
jgi:hypothetical protein